MADRTESVILSFDVDLEDSVSSIEKLTKANKELREERKKLNLDTNEGKKRVGEINAQLDKNTSKITANTSAIEKQRANIGNYKSALDGVHPALGKVGQGLEAGTSGLKAMTMQALRFIATPIGAVIAALVAVFALLKSALSQNDALMDKFENITNAVGVVLEIVVSRVGKLGEALIALASGNFSEAIDLTSQAFSGLADEIEGAVKQQQIFLNESRNIADAERKLRIEVAKSANVITSLIKESKNRNLSLDEQSAKLIEASKLEANLQRSREDIALRNLRVTARQLRSAKEFQQSTNETFEQYVTRLLDSGKLGDEELNKLTDSVVALEEARNSGLVLQQKIENDLAGIEDKRTEAVKKQTEALKEQAIQDAANRRLANKEVRSSKDGVKRQDRGAPSTDPLVDQAKTRADLIDGFDKRLSEDLIKRNKATQAEIVSDKQKSAELEKQIENAKLAFTSNVLGSIGSLVEEQSVEGKIIATAQAVINTYLAATAALASGSEVNPIFGILSAAAAIAAGLASVAKINEVQFEQGGVVLRGRSHAQGGIPIEAEGDEIILTKGVFRNPQLRQMASAINVAGGGRKFADGGLVSNSISQPINQQLNLANIIKELGPFEVSAREITKIQNRVKVKEKISKR